MVAVITIDENYLDDFVVPKDIRIRIDSIYNRIRRLFPRRQSCVQRGNLLWNVAVVVDDGTFSPLVL